MIYGVFVFYYYCNEGMEGSRLSRIGQQTLKNRSNFTMMQDISPNQFSDDQPLQNHSTFFYDETGAQIDDPSAPHLPSAHSPTQDSKIGDMYALPEKAHKKPTSYTSRNNSMPSETMLATKNSLKSAKNEAMKDTMKSKKGSLLSIRRPKGFTKYRAIEGSESDFIGGDLY